MKKPFRSVLAMTAFAALPLCVLASSHREAPNIAKLPAVDSTDFYMFNSYEPGRTGYVTILANYYPLQDPFGGPNYFALDQNARYEIHIDNNGDAREDLTFRFQFTNALANKDRGITVPTPGPYWPGRRRQHGLPELLRDLHARAGAGRLAPRQDAGH
jgi:hypothetical protein